MSKNHKINYKSNGVNLPPSEAHLASICVAIVFGFIGGSIGTLLTVSVPFWSMLLFVIILGFFIPWVVCKYLFKTAHTWYGGNSLAHRLYDGVGIIAAIIAFCILR